MVVVVVRVLNFVHICRFCLSMKLNRYSNSDENQFNRLRNGVFTYGMVQPTVCDTLFQYVQFRVLFVCNSMMVFSADGPIKSVCLD